MRWNIVFIFLCTLQVAGINGNAQQKVSLNLKDATIEQLFREIKRQTGFDFVYNEEQSSSIGKVNLNAQNQLIDEILDRILTPKGFTWSITDGIILVKAVAQKQQENTAWIIKGNISDNSGLPLPGVAVLIKGTSRGVVTDNNGNYTITVPTNQESTLVFSFLGMKTLERKIKQEGTIDIVMENEVVDLTDVIVTGYQSIKQEDATGSFATVKAEDLEKRYSDNILESLEGRIPGLVSYNTGMNSGRKTLSIRGINTFTNSINPLIVVDGLPIEGSIDDINPYDIASITVLKDAAAAAIYGARSANGVVVITTKIGSPNKTVINVSADWTINQKYDYKYFNYVNAKEQVELEKSTFEVLLNNLNLNILLPYFQMMPQGYMTEVASAYVQHNDGLISREELDNKLDTLSRNDFLKEYKKHALLNEIVQRYNISVRGRAGKLLSNFVMNFRNSNTGIINTYDRNANISFRGEYPAYNWLKLTFGTNINLTWNKSHNNRFATDPFSVPAYTRLFNDKGERNYYSTTQVYNLDNNVLNNTELKSMDFNHLDELERDFIKDKRVNTRFYAHSDFKVIDEIMVSGQFQYEDIHRDVTGLSEAESYTTRYLYNIFTNLNNEHILPDGAIMRKENHKETYYTFRAQATYNQVFQDKHSVNAITGYELRQTKYRMEKTMLLGYDDKLLTNQMGYVDLKTMKEMTSTALFPFMGQNPSSVFDSQLQPNFDVDEVNHNYVSYYFNANYTYDHRYSIFASLRKDFTDLFGTDKKFRGRPLWSIGLGWNVQNEDFFKGYNFINALKLRLSYGYTGNIDQNTSSYLTATTTTNSYTGSQMSTLSIPPNEQLRWEKTGTFNLGIDYIMWENRLRGSLDWYRKYSTDLLAATPLDPSEGFTQLTINNGEALNTGIEFSLTGRWIQSKNAKGFGWNSTINLGYNKNEIKKVKIRPVSSGSLISGGLVEGRPIRALYSYKYKGLDKITQKNTDTYGEDFPTRELLWEKGDGTVTTENPRNFLPEDVVFSGPLDPKITMGFENEFTFKAFSLSAMFAYYGGHKMRADQWYELGQDFLGYGYTGAIPKYLLNSWNPDTNPNTMVPGSGIYRPEDNSFEQLRYADIFVVPADFIKLRNVTLTYHFSNEICSKIHLGGLNIRIQGNNLWTWKKNNLGIDPEANNAYSGGRSLRQRPSATVSLNVKF